MAVVQGFVGWRGGLGRSRVWAAAVVVSAATSVSACSSGDEGAAAHVVSLTGGDTGTTVDAARGDVLEVTLQTVGPGSYDSPSASLPVLRFLGQDKPGPQNPGGPRQLYRFRAESGGTVTVTIPHSMRPDPFEMTVVVR